MQLPSAATSERSLGPHVLLTGAAGLIGREVANTLKRTNCQVLCVDREAAPPGLAENQDSHRHDQCDLIKAGEKQLLALCKNVSTIVHLAGQPAVWFAKRFPDEDLLVNVYATVRLFCAAEKAGVQRFIFASSGTVFPKSNVAPSEDDEQKPENPYGLSKSTAERYLRYLGANARPPIEVVIFRPAYVVGRNLQRNVLYDIAQAFAQGQPKIDLFTSADSVFNFVDVADVAQAIGALVRAPRGGVPKTLHLCSNENTSVRQIIAAYERISGRSVPIAVKPDCEVRQEVGMRSGYAAEFGLHFRSILLSGTMELLYERLREEYKENRNG